MTKTGVTETFTPVEQETATIINDLDSLNKKKKKEREEYEHKMIMKDVGGQTIRDAAVKSLSEKPQVMKKEVVTKKKKEINENATISESITAFVSTMVQDNQIRMMELKNEQRRQKIQLKELRLKLGKKKKSKKNKSQN